MVPSPGLAGVWAWFRTTTMPANRVAVGDTQRTCADVQPTDANTCLGSFGAAAFPDSDTVCRCGACRPVSVTSSNAVRRPAAVGVNVTVMVQLAAAASVAPVQVSALVVKLNGFAPAIAVEVTGSGSLLVFVIVTVCGGEARRRSSPPGR